MTKRYYLDTEFHEYKKSVRSWLKTKSVNTIELISIGIVSEDNREYYAVSNEFDVKAAWNNKWLKENVLFPIFQELCYGDSGFSLDEMQEIIMDFGKSNEEIKQEVQMFTGIITTDKPKKKSPTLIEFYGYYADYDWVVFSWLYGKMINLPEEYPMYCLDLKQMMHERELTSQWKTIHCPDPEDEHNALADAKWNMKLHREILKQDKLNNRAT